MASNSGGGGGGGKRGPSVLVTDSRERPQSRGTAQRPNVFSGPHALNRSRTSTRLISVDNVLQYASEIPSGQARGPPGRRPVPTGPRRLGGGPLLNTPPAGSLGARVAQANVPGRSTKVSEKLVLIPDTLDEKNDDAGDVDEGPDIVDLDGADLGDAGDGQRPYRDEEWRELRTKGNLRGKSYAERLPKARRKDKLARVTAYCTAQAYKLKATASFLRDWHGARTKLYDDCLYTVYHLPLQPGSEGYRIRSSPILKSPGGKAVLDEEIERSERRDYHEGYFEDTSAYEVRDGEESPRNEGESPEERDKRIEERRRGREEARQTAEHRKALDTSPNRITPDATTFAEMFVFSYGVVVFWNFTERQEKDVLADLTFSSSPISSISATLQSASRATSNALTNNSILTGPSLVVRPQDESSFETEEFHFEYNVKADRPRVFNDMITLRSGDHMVKLAISHAIAQSTKLSFFEERMARTMGETQGVPRRLALEGTLGMERKEIVRILGQLFMSRVDVNLSSNILDVPNFFWDSEPTLHPLYFAVREYLEIAPRIKVLNERCRVFLDLAEILSDSIADAKMSTITWIIIVLIVVSIAVTVTEVGLRFSILEKEKSGGGAGAGGGVSRGSSLRLGTQLGDEVNRSLWMGSESELKNLCGARYLEKTFKDEI